MTLLKGGEKKKKALRLLLKRKKLSGNFKNPGRQEAFLLCKREEKGRKINFATSNFYHNGKRTQTIEKDLQPCEKRRAPLLPKGRATNFRKDDSGGGRRAREGRKDEGVT